jgi:hypothetical protein
MKTYPRSRNAALAAAMAIGVVAIAAGQAAGATVVSEAPLQRHLQLTCVTGNSSCNKNLGPVPANERWVIQFVSCTGDGGFGTTLRNFSAMVTAGGKLVVRHYIAPTYRSAAEPFIYVASQPMLLTVSEGNVLSLGSVSVGGTFNVACGISGVRQKLQ